MKKKLMIIILSVLLLGLVVVLFMLLNEKEEYYSCSFSLDETLKLSINYDVYYDNNEKVIRNEITKTYRANNSSEREYLINLKKEINSSNVNYSNNYNGFNYKILRDTASVYSYMMIIETSRDVLKYKDLFETYENLEKQKEYFSSKYGTICE